MSLDAATDDLRSSFKLAMRRFPAAVTVITSADQTRRHGMTATAVTSLSMDPPSLVVRFCVNLLRRDQVALSAAFRGALPPETRFGLGEWAVSPEGISYLENAQINIFCKKAAAVPYGTHTIFIGEAELVNVRDPIDPLIYQDATYCFSVPAEIKAA